MDDEILCPNTVLPVIPVLSMLAKFTPPNEIAPSILIVSSTWILEAVIEAEGWE